MSPLAFAACFAVWTIFSIIGIGIKGELDLNETKFGLLIATPILGIFMPLGSAAVFRHIPVYYPNHVGPVGGGVGMIGGLGGFVLPITFGLLNDWTGLWTSCFMLLFLTVAGNLLWMHAAVLRMERAPAVATDRHLEQGIGVKVTP
jgi:NNP family nitrate/nitrite transporter-like MFS transporter